MLIGIKLRGDFRFFLSILFGLNISNLSAQISFNQKLNVNNKLIKKGYHEEAILHLNSFDYILDQNQKDSLNFQWGKAFFYAKDFPNAISYFQQINNSASLSSQGCYFSNLSALYESNFSYTFCKIKDDGFNKLFEKGLLVLKGELNEAKGITGNDLNNFLIRKHIKDLNGVIDQVENHKNKSPFLAASLSTVIPGLGKMYAGKVGEGFASLLLVGALAGSSIEQFQNGGPQNVQFWLLAIPATIFYIGNIYGSYFSVQVSNIEFNEEIRNEVLFHLHIPFKSFYRH